MTDSSALPPGRPAAFDLVIPQVRVIDRGAPWTWLAAGWRDLRAAGSIGFLYGFAFSAFGLLLTAAIWFQGAIYLLLPLAAGFMLIGPIAAVGLYEVSRRLERRQPVTLGGALTAWKGNATQIALMGVVLLIFHLIWARAATLLFALFFSEAPPRPEILDLLRLTLSLDGIPFLAVGTAIGAVLATAVFAISAVSIPMLLDRRDTNVIVAIATSVEAVRRNVWAMGLWAWLIVVFIAAGLATGFVGLIVTLPLIGHATWHAYRATVVFDDQPAAVSAVNSGGRR